MNTTPGPAWLPGRPLMPGQRRLVDGRLYYLQVAEGVLTVIERKGRAFWRGLPPLDVYGSGTFSDFRRFAGLS